MPSTYTVKIPKPDFENEYEEFGSFKPKQIQEKLNISSTIFYRILNKTMKFHNNDVKHLQGIIIEKDIKVETKKITKEDIINNQLEYRKNTIEKLKS